MWSLLFFLLLPQAFADTSVWSEFISYDSVETQLPELKAHQLTLNLAFSESNPDYDGLANLLRKASAEGVAVRPWLLLSEAHGYWFNKWNFKFAEAFTRTFVKELSRRGVKLPWIIFDVEAPPSLTREAERDLNHRNVFGLIRLLRASSRDGSIAKAREDYASLVDELHRQGIKVMAVTSNFILHDSRGKLEDAFGIPMSGIPWDEVSVMAYRAEYIKSLGEVSPWIVREYARRAVKRFGSRASMAVGEVGKVDYPQPFEGYAQPSDLQEDMRACLQEGIQNVSIYSLDGMEAQGLTHWLTPVRLAPSVADLKARLLIDGFDALKFFLPRAD